MPIEQVTVHRRFTRKNRLLKAAEFKAVFDGAEFRVAHPNLLLLAVANELSYPRVGLVVAKKHVRRAVARNRIKRVVRESFRLFYAELDSLDVVFLARHGIDKLTRSEQTALLRHSWRRLAHKVAAATK